MVGLVGTNGSTSKWESWKTSPFPLSSKALTSLPLPAFISPKLTSKIPPTKSSMTSSLLLLFWCFQTPTMHKSKVNLTGSSSSPSLYSSQWQTGGIPQHPPHECIQQLMCGASHPLINCTWAFKYSVMVLFANPNSLWSEQTKFYCSPI